MVINLIQIYLDKQDKNQRWLQKATGMSYQTINNWCANRAQPTLKMVEEVAELLKVDPHALIYFGTELDIVKFLKEANVSQDKMLLFIKNLKNTQG